MRDRLTPTDRSIGRLARWAWDILSEPARCVWRHRDLFARVLAREIQAQFRGSALGLFWMVLIPVVLVSIYTFVFGVVMDSPWSSQSSTPLEAPLMYFAGLSIFAFAFEVLNRAPGNIRNHVSYVKKVVFPLHLLAWVMVCASGARMLVGLTLLWVLGIVLLGQPPYAMLAVLLVLVPLVLMLVGIAWILSATGAYIRDLGHVLVAIGPVIMFVSPVFYGLDQVPPTFHPIYWINPLTFPLEATRQLLFLDGNLPWHSWLAYSLSALVVLIFGFYFFERARPSFADVV